MKYNIAEFVLLKKSLKPGQKLNVLTTSMEPFFTTGEAVCVDPVNLEELKPFDIIVYWEEKRSVLVCHIYKELKDEKLICMPLASKKYDLPIHPTLLLARVTSPTFNWFQKFLLKWFR